MNHFVIYENSNLFRYFITSYEEVITYHCNYSNICRLFGCIGKPSFILCFEMMNLLLAFYCGQFFFDISFNCYGADVECVHNRKWLTEKTRVLIENYIRGKWFPVRKNNLTTCHDNKKRKIRNRSFTFVVQNTST